MRGENITYTVNASDEFTAWWTCLDEELHDSIAAYIGLLEQYGSQLGRPYADTLRGSTIANLKELRVQHQGKPYRILYAFDPQRAALLLIGGNKEGDKRWYKKAIPQAELIFKRHLKELEENHG